jgi:glycosyltransferase involved in cell wall biosynthesis
MTAVAPRREKPFAVTQIITGLGSGGAERQLATLVLNSDPALVRHTVVSLLDDGVWGTRLRQKGIAVHCLGLAQKLAAPLVLPKLVRLLRESDLIQTWLYHADIIGLVAAKFSGKPIAWTLRSSGLPPGVAGWQTRVLVRLLAKLSMAPRAVIANAIEGQRFHQTVGYRPQRWAVIPNGIDCDQFHPDPQVRSEIREELKVPESARLIANLSRHDPWKDHPTLLAAFARQSRDTWLLLAGDKTEPGNALLDAQVVAAGADPGRILRLGRRSDMPRLNAALDLAVLSSVSEGFPNVIAEAMACAVPAVGTSVGDIALIIGDAGAVVSPSDPVALGDAIAGILSLDPVAHAELGRKARKRIETKFSVPAMVEAYRALYEDILTSPTRSRN